MSTSPTFVVTASGLVILIALELRSAELVELALEGRARLHRALSYVVVSLGLALVLRLFGTLVTPGVPAVVAIELPLPLTALACVMVGELINYWFHRLGHGSLWCLHFAHHIEERFSILLGAQAHAGEIALRGVVVAVSLALLGFPTPVVEIYLGFFVLGACYQHSAHDYSLGPLDWFLVNPAYHRYHHAKGKHCNFGATIVTWDLVFGTFARPVHARELELGISGWTGPYGYRAELCYPLTRLWPRRLKMAAASRPPRAET